MKVKMKFAIAEMFTQHSRSLYYDDYVCMFFRSSNMRLRMGVVVGSPKEGMLNRSPGTWEGGGPSTDCCHLHIILSIYSTYALSSYQFTINQIFCWVYMFLNQLYLYLTH